MRKHLRGIALAVLAPPCAWASAQDPVPTPTPMTAPVSAVAPDPAAWTTAVAPKPISPAVRRGLDWLAEHQLKDGGWGQGDESQHMGGSSEFRDRPNVADTAIAALALIRAGSTPAAGPHRDAVARAVTYVRSEVEAADAVSLDVSPVKGTRVQGKLGPNIDTFLAALLLAEVKGKMGDPAANQSLDLALNKVLTKIKTHQQADGTWDNRTGWAPILAQSMAGKGINRAAQAGAKVDGALLARTEDYAKLQLAANAAPAVLAAPAAAAAAEPIAVASAKPVAGRATTAAVPDPADALFPPTAELRSAGRAGGMGGMAGGMGGMDSARGRTRAGGGMGSAGVELYDRAASLAVLSDSVNSNAALEAEARKQAETSKDAGEVERAREQIKRFDSTKAAHAEARDAVVRRLEDKAFVAGFGSNGGEEFLSYMNIGEGLVRQGGPEWTKWDAAMTVNLGRIQNDDGSWSGHHCITGRTFCTATALLVLLSDRTPVPVVAGKDKGPAAPVAR